MRRLKTFFLLVFVVLALGSAGRARERPFFEAKVRIPFALQAGSKVLQPDEYLLAVHLLGNERILTLQTSKGEMVLRTAGQRVDDVPEEDRNFKQRFQMKIRRVQDPEAGKHWIVFDLDYRPGNRDVYRRLTFRVPEAGKTAE